MFLLVLIGYWGCPTSAFLMSLSWFNPIGLGANNQDQHLVLLTQGNAPADASAPALSPTKQLIPVHIPYSAPTPSPPSQFASDFMSASLWTPFPQFSSPLTGHDKPKPNQLNTNWDMNTQYIHCENQQFGLSSFVGQSKETTIRTPDHDLIPQAWGSKFHHGGNHIEYVHFFPSICRATKAQCLFSPLPNNY